MQVRVPQRREPQLSGTVITPWKPSLETASSRAQAQQQVITQSPGTGTYLNNLAMMCSSAPCIPPSGRAV